MQIYWVTRWAQNHCNCLFSCVSLVSLCTNQKKLSSLLTFTITKPKKRLATGKESNLFLGVVRPQHEADSPLGEWEFSVRAETPCTNSYGEFHPWVEFCIAVQKLAPCKSSVPFGRAEARRIIVPDEFEFKVAANRPKSQSPMQHRTNGRPNHEKAAKSRSNPNCQKKVNNRCKDLATVSDM